MLKIKRRKESQVRHIDDCKTIINYLEKNLEYPDLYFESGSMRSDLFYQRKIVEYFIKDAERLHFRFEVHAEIADGEPQTICQCDDKETAEFIVSALRHGMPRYWDIKEIEDE